MAVLLLRGKQKMAELAEWIAVDWGASNLHVWVFGADGQQVAHKTSSRSIASLTPEAFEPALLELIAPHLGDGPTPVICCGMVGAPQGWQEAMYLTAPCPPPGLAEASHIAAKDPRIAPVILPGIQQTTPADVMRGEETQIAGFIAQNPAFDGVLCLPGTHTKWVRISAEEVVSFVTFMTGEMLALFSDSSVLRNAVNSEGWDQAAFEDAVNDMLSSPQNLGARLFGLRAATLVNTMSTEIAKSRLSGSLIGLELAGARPYWLGQQIAIVGDAKIANLYKFALEQQGAFVAVSDGTEMTIAGLKAAYSGWNELFSTT